MQLLDALNDLGDMERFAGSAEYVVYHVDLGRTFAGQLGLAWFGAQTPYGSELCLKRNLKRT